MTCLENDDVEHRPELSLYRDEELLAGDKLSGGIGHLYHAKK